MIYPAVYDITILQNATWRGIFRATQNRKEISSISVATDVPTFTSKCHGLTAGTRVVFTGTGETPCGLVLNKIYYVISAGLTNSEFQVSATSGGSSISVSGSANGKFYVAEPLDLNGYTVDSDIKRLVDGTDVASFTPSIIAAADGEFSLTLSPAVTAPLEVGIYGYDASLTSPAGDRYYWLTGIATVKTTYSRN